MKITEVLKTQSWDNCICCSGTKTYPNGDKYPIRTVNIRYYGSKSGTMLTLCSACANDLANELRAIDYTDNPYRKEKEEEKEEDIDHGEYDR